MYGGSVYIQGGLDRRRFVSKIMNKSFALISYDR